MEVGSSFFLQNSRTWQTTKVGWREVKVVLGLGERKCLTPEARSGIFVVHC